MLEKYGRKFIVILMTLAMVISLIPALTQTASATAVDLSQFPQANEYGAAFATSDNGDMKLTVYKREGEYTSPYADYNSVRGDMYVGDYEDDFGVDYVTFEKSNGSLFSANSITIKPYTSNAIISIYGLDAGDNLIGNGITTSSIPAGLMATIDLAADGDFTLIKKLKIVVPGTGYFISALDVTTAVSCNAPTLTATGATPTFTENGSAVGLFSGVTATTNDSSQTFNSMTLTVSNVTDTTEYLSIGSTELELANGKSGTLTGIGSYSVAVSSNTATVTVSGMSLSDTQMVTLIDGITYRNSSDDPSTANSRAIKITNITDSGSSSNSYSPDITATVSITAVNDVPTVKTNAGITVNEGSTDNAIAKGKLEIADVDTAASSITYTLTAVPSKGTLKKSGTILNTTTNSTFTQDDINNNRLTYSHDGSETVADNFKFTVSDGAGGSIVETTFAITVNAVNDLPTITNSTKNGTEDTTLTFAATDFTDNYSDAESSALSEIEIVTLPSASQGILKLDGNNITVGQKIASANLTKITFQPVANFSGNASFTWKASDGTDYSSTAATITLAIAGENDAPNITSGDPASFAENGTGAVYTATATDPDASDTLTWSISGTDSGLFNINSSTGVLTFKAAPNFEAPADSDTNNVYDLTVTVTDNGTGNLTATKTIAITVTNVNEAPTITSGATTSFTENGVGTVYTATGSDEDGNSITWSISGTDTGLFSIDGTTGVLTFKTAPDFESPADSGGNNVYDLTITATDNGTGALTANKAVTINVTNMNEAPSITSGDPASFAENGTGAVYTATATDPDASDTLTWSISGTDAGLFNINSSTGVLTFKAAPNFEAPADSDTNNVYNLTVTVTDNGTGNLTATKTISITVTNLNEAPTITSGETASFTENGTGTVYTAAGSDQDGNSITWGISGTDAGLFSIDGTTGVLTFKTAPDFESPADSGGNNVYDLTINATDGTLSVAKTITVTVTRLGDADLASVLSQAITAGSEAGTKGTPKTASISVADTVSSVSSSDIIKHDNSSTVTFYGKDSTFTTSSAGSVNLMAGAGTNVYIKVVATDNNTLYYKVTVNRAPLSIYTVNYKNNYNNSDTTVFTTQTVVSGNKATAPEQPARSGYTFGGWYTETGCTTAWNFKNNPVTGNTILYAKWTAVPIPTYTVTYAENGATSGSIPLDSNDYKSGNTVIVKANTGSLAKAGYTFGGWSYNGTTYTAGQNLTISGNLTLTAVWTAVPATYTAIYNQNYTGGGTYTTQSSIAAGATLTAPIAPTRTSYTFIGWYKDTACANPWVFITDTVKANTNLYAKWVKNIYSVSGTVCDDATPVAAVSGATVKVIQGNIQFGETATTDGNGSFTVTGVPDGTYNLVVTKDNQEVTVCIEVTGSNYTYTGSIVLPSGNKNSKLDVIGSETPNVVVDGLNSLFDDNTSNTDSSKGYTADDKQTVDNGGSVEIKLTVQKNDNSTNKATVEAAMSSKGYTSETVLDVDMTKTSTTNNGVSQESAITATINLIKVIIPLPAELQGKASYVVYRAHDYGSGVVIDEITTTPKNGEYIAVSSDKTQIIAYLKYFSTYAIAYTNSSTTPSAPSSGSGSTVVSSYVITSTASTGGSISESGSIKVTAGQSKTYTITADKGYNISDVLVDGKSFGAVSSYTFSNVSSAHEIKAVFVKNTGLPYYVDDKGVNVFIGFASDASGTMKYIAPKGKTVLFKKNPKSFTDISGNWAKSYMDFVTEREIFYGTGRNTFSPNTGMTRAMFVTVIGRLYERSYSNITTTGTKNQFTDVDYDAYYGEYVDWAAENGVVTGVGSGKFEPDRQITREEMAVIIYRFAVFLKISTTESGVSQLSYPDASAISAWVTDAAKYCQQTGIISGRDGGKFVPKGTATRAEVATILQRFIENTVK